MKMAILMAGAFGVTPFTDGRKVQIQKQAAALERLGHEVVRLNPWESYPLESCDAVHIVQGGLGNIAGYLGPLPNVRKMGMATFLDTNLPSWALRMSRLAGQFDPRFNTNQSIIFRQSLWCDVVIARSRDERRILVSGIGLPEEKVKIVLNGVDAPTRIDPTRAVKELGVNGDFVFHISTFLDPRKNAVRMIRAVTELGLPLVIAGTADNDAWQGVVDRAAAGNAKIRFLGEISAELRDSLYAACRVFCLPSLYEGTGLAALEAASYGANVVITERGGPPDYFESYAEYVNPESVESIRAAIERAWNKPRDGRLKNHVISKLSWESSARALVAAYGF
jgi:glycosyltransferase involved in cell wall biosynthesis